MKKIILLTLTCSVLFTINMFGQFPGCPAVSTATNVTIPCGQTCTNLTANAFAGAQTTTYGVSSIPYSPPFSFNTGTQVLINIDDRWSSVINLPFSFCYFGNTYSQIIVGSNGVCSFNTTNAGAFNSWNIPGQIPSATPADLTNCIMGPWQDMDPTNQGQIFYEIGGTSPCRYIKFSWYQQPMYGDPNSVNTSYCSAQSQTQQIVLYETTNVIDMYIQNKGVCSGWNGGLAIQGIQNANGTVAFTVPGRNATVWTASNDAWRFTPAGAPNYTIAWFQGGTQIGTGSTINVCPAGPTTYTAEATYNSCGATTVVSSNVNVGFSGVSISIDSVHQVSCAGGSDGAVYASFNTGSAILSYGWTPGGAGQTHIDGIPAGTYIFSVTDSANCTRSDTVTLTDPPQLIVSVPDTTITSCNTNPTTNLQANVSGGTPGYTYLWGGGETVNPLTNVGAGTYTLTVTDSKSCTANDAGTVSITTGNVTFNQPTIVNASCAGNDGSITVSVTGAVAPVTFTWSNSLPNGDTQTGLSGGTYSVTATDANGCSATASYTVTQPSPITINTPVVAGATCAGNDGSIIVTLNGATDPVNYVWSGGLANNDTVTGVAAGTYTLVATDANGCSASASATVGQAGSFTFGTPVITDATCGGNDGSIVVTVVGAAAPVNYAWSGGLANNDTVTGLAAGTYTVTATDANGCSASASYSVGQGTTFTLGSPVITDASCGANDGSIIVNTGTAVQPVNFTWSGGLPNNDTLTGLAVGNYSVTATDANGCSATATYSVGQGSSIFITSAIVLDESCTGPGSINITATGGTGTLTYSWSGGLSGNPLANLTAGTYDLTITDQGGCSVTASYILGNSPCGDCPAVSTNNNVTIPCGQTCATLTASAVAGYQTTAYTGSAITYSPASFSTGTPILVGTDDIWSSAITLPFNFCFFGNTYGQLYVGSNGVIGFNAPPILNDNSWLINGPIPSVLPVDMLNTIMGPWQDMDPTNQGQINYSIIGNYPCRQFVISWYQVPMYGDPNSVSPGSCSAQNQTQQIILYETTNVIDIYIQNKGVCSGWNGGLAIEGIQNSTGTVAYAVPGRNATVWTATNDGYRFTPSGAPNYVINWFNGTTPIGTGDTISVCPDSTTIYTVQAVYTNCDNSTITVADSVNVTVQGGLTATVDSVVNVSCPGATDGEVYASYTSTNGTVTSFGWTPGGANQTTMTGLPAGTYVFTVANSTGCIVSDTAEVIEPAPLVVNVPDTTLYNCSAGVVTTSLTATASGGTAGYTYLWGSGDTTQTITGVGAGTYNITATDANGCTATDAGTITQVQASPAFNQPVITNVTCNGNNNGSITVSVSQATAPVVYTWSGNLPNGDTQTGLGQGSYTVTATDANGCSVSATYNITEPAAITLGQPVITNADCSVGGTITVTATGGTGTLNYSWSNGDTGTLADSLAAGNYSLTVTDTAGCSVTASFTVNSAPNSVAFGTPTITDASCNGGNNGGITCVATGGTGNITYTWSTGATTATISGLGAGQYCVTATDNTGCSATACYTVNEPTAITLGTPQINDVTCQSSGDITVTATGGTGNLSYSWSNGDTGTFADSLPAGSVTVTVTDANNCSASGTFTIGTAAGTLVFGSPIVNNISCHGANDGSITVSTTGGTGNVTYTWNTNPQQVGTTITGLSAGSYTVTASDQGRCTVSATFNITDPAQFSVSVNATAYLCFGDTTGTATANATGGTGNYTYHWNTGDTSQAVINQPVGIILVTVTDGNGCTASSSSIIGQSPSLSYNSQINQPSCADLGFGTWILTPRGGTGSIQITITQLSIDTTLTMTGADTAAQFSNVPTGCYNFVLTDSVGCSIPGNFCVNAGAANESFDVEVDSTSCYGEQFKDGGITIAPKAQANAPYTYSLNGGAFQSDSAFTGLTAGSYILVTKNNYGCLDTLNITVPQPAQVFVDATPDTIITAPNVGNEVTVNAQNFINPVYNWSPMTGVECADTLMCTNPTITVQQNSVYYIVVNEANNEGCAASDSVVIIVASDLKMPNAFTPNADGKNDVFGPVNGDKAAFTVTDFRIYNRWGQLIHNNIENWDGKFKGKDQPADTYIYYIAVKTPDAANPGTLKTEISQGAVTLIR